MPANDFALMAAYVEFKEQGIENVVNGLTRLKTAAAGALKVASTISDTMRGAFSALSGMIGASGIGDFLRLAETQADAEQRLAEVLRLTGNAAGYTAEELYAVAGQLQRVTEFGDETTISAMALLASFDRIQGNTFIRATKAAQDMATFFGTDLNTAIQTLGRALQYPEQGLMALRRAGILLTQEEKERIITMAQSGNVAGAQAEILTQIEKRYGGFATKMVSPMKQLQNVLGDIGEAIGKILSPAVEKLSELGTAIASWALENTATLQDWAAKVSGAVGVITEPITTFFKLVTNHSEVAWAFAWLKLREFIDRATDGLTILGRTAINFAKILTASLIDVFASMPKLLWGMTLGARGELEAVIGELVSRAAKRMTGIFAGVTEGLGKDSAATEAARSAFMEALQKEGVSSLDELLQRQNAIDEALLERPPIPAQALRSIENAITTPIEEATAKMGEVTSIAFDRLQGYFQQREEKRLQEEAAKAAKASEAHLRKIAEKGIRIENLDELELGWL